MLRTKFNFRLSSLESLKAGSIFSAFVSNGKLARFLRVSSKSGADTLFGVVTIGPFWDEGEPFWYSDSVLDGYRLLDETAIVKFHASLPGESITDKELSTGVAGGVYCTSEGSILLGVRRQIGRTVGTFVDIETGESRLNFNYADGAYLGRYSLVAENEAGKNIKIFDSSYIPI